VLSGFSLSQTFNSKKCIITSHPETSCESSNILSAKTHIPSLETFQALPIFLYYKNNNTLQEPTRVSKQQVLGTKIPYMRWEEKAEEHCNGKTHDHPSKPSRIAKKQKQDSDTGN
jgi:hypothetical protein